MSQSQIISLTANTAASVTFEAPADYEATPPNIYVDETYTIDRSIYSVEVVNRDGNGEVWFTVNGSIPTVDGDDQSYVPAIQGASHAKRAGGASTVIVRLISNANTSVYLEAI